MKTRAKKPDLCDTVAAAISDIVTVTYIIRPGDPLPPELMPRTEAMVRIRERAKAAGRPLTCDEEYDLSVGRVCGPYFFGEENRKP